MANDILTGKIEVTDTAGSVVMIWNGETGQAAIGGGWVSKVGVHGHPGDLTVNNQYGQPQVEISNGAINAGGHGSVGILSLHNETSSSVPRILLNADHPILVITTPMGNNGGSYDVIRLDGATGDIAAGGNLLDGELTLLPAGVHGSNPAADKSKATIRLRALDAGIRAGVAGMPGQLLLVNGTGKTLLYVAEEQPAGVTPRASMYLGGHGLDGKITVFDSASKSQIFIDGKNGDIVLGNADCAEEFDLISGEGVEPGAVMVLDAEGGLRLSDQPYDRKVAGVISGAGSLKPGIILDRRESAGPRAALAMVGKVYCKADATQEPIDVGDLLTSSAVPGHAMRAGDPLRAFGAVIGKALGSLRAGQGLIPILVALQ